MIQLYAARSALIAGVFVIPIGIHRCQWLADCHPAMQRQDKPHRVYSELTPVTITDAFYMSQYDPSSLGYLSLHTVYRPIVNQSSRLILLRQKSRRSYMHVQKYSTNELKNHIRTDFI